MKYYTAVERNQPKIYTTGWIDLKNTISCITIVLYLYKIFFKKCKCRNRNRLVVIWGLTVGLRDGHDTFLGNDGNDLKLAYTTDYPAK